VLATATVLTELGLGGGTGTKLIALVIIAGLIVLAGVVGFSLIMRLQTVITIVTGALTIVYIILVLGQVDLAAVSALPAGSVPAVVGGLVFMMTGFGLGWVNAAADYSRYLPAPPAAVRWSAGRRSVAHWPPCCWWCSGCSWPGPRPS
jgi:purine-cytosine permease-like protein